MQHAYELLIHAHRTPSSSLVPRRARRKVSLHQHQEHAYQLP
ncbi:CLUMA_CG001252, isoform A [Clunio marinus]|uniref:CLUMA_CG001252, isoform A n=1 Tax=Clunio marinus TaxID=568069 RepID=A0A1J1HHT1_9DIPT|nr:CLUMA_CG001252, isoform A [Clunio marinus]